MRVSALPEAVADEKSTPADTYALPLHEVAKMVGALRGVLSDWAGAVGDNAALRERCEAALVAAKLKPEDIRGTFLQPFAKKASPVCQGGTTG